MRELESSDGHDWRSCDVCCSDPVLQDVPSASTTSKAESAAAVDGSAAAAEASPGKLQEKANMQQQESQDAAASSPTDCMDGLVYAAASGDVVTRQKLSEDVLQMQDSSETTDECQEAADQEDCHQHHLPSPSSQEARASWDLMDDAFGPLLSLRFR